MSFRARHGDRFRQGGRSRLGQALGCVPGRSGLMLCALLAACASAPDRFYALNVAPQPRDALAPVANAPATVAPGAGDT